MKDIEYFVFQGGSVRGACYVGALNAIAEKNNGLPGLKAVAGTSAGAIVAMMLATGYRLDIIENELRGMKFVHFLDEQHGHTNPTVLSAGRSVEKGSASTDLFSAPSHASSASRVASRLSKTFGIYDGEYFRNWSEDHIIVKTGIEHCTFLELHKLHLSNPDKYRDLFVYGVNLTTGLTQPFSYLHTPDAIISDAVRISMSIPFIYVPHVRYNKVAGERVPDPSGHIYVDGGLNDNYKLDAFDHRYFVDSGLEWNGSGKQRVINNKVLGFRLVSDEKKDFFEGRVQAPEKKTEYFLAYFSVLLQAIKGKQDSDHVLNADQERTVYIDTKGVGMLDFDLTEADVSKLIDSGAEAVNNHVARAKSFLK